MQGAHWALLAPSACTLAPRPPIHVNNRRWCAKVALSVWYYNFTCERMYFQDAAARRRRRKHDRELKYSRAVADSQKMAEWQQFVDHLGNTAWYNHVSQQTVYSRCAHLSHVFVYQVVVLGLSVCPCFPVALRERGCFMTRRGVCECTQLKQLALPGKMALVACAPQLCFRFLSRYCCNKSADGSYDPFFRARILNCFA